MRNEKRGRKKVTQLRNFGKWGYWNRISKKMIIPLTPAATHPPPHLVNFNCVFMKIYEL